MSLIRLRRQGVSDTVNARFAPCPHGHEWFIELQQNVGAGGYAATLSYPNCPACFDPPSPPLKWDGRSNESYGVYLKAIDDYRKACCSGQVAWRGRTVDTLDDAKALALSAIRGVIDPHARWMAGIEAYCLYTPSDLAAYPRLKDDYYFTCASYDVAQECIRHEPTGAVLITFCVGAEECLISDDVKPQYHEQCAKAIVEYEKEHVQRDGKARARTWLAWLLGEYIKDEVAGQEPVVLPSIRKG